ncbi:MAG: trypsin-like peptidase domain-containing protein [Isosphaeraceae bacterium]
MSLHASTVRNRVALSLACGTIFAALLGASLYFGSVARRQPGHAPGRADKSGTRAGSLNSPQDLQDEAKSDQPERAAAGGLTEPNRRSRGGTEASVESLAHGPGQDQGRNDDANDDELFQAFERLERRMAAGMARARESVVSLEYTAAESTPGSRRIATGVVINSRGDVISVRIDPPSSTASTSPVSGPSGGAARSGAGIVARDASGRRHLASWVAVDPESGLTLLQIAPRAVRPIEMAGEEATLGSQVFVVGNPFGLGHSVSRGHIAGLDRALKLGSRQLGGLIQVQATLYPGDSGAVVANLRGQLLGVIRSGLAVPSPSAGRIERDNDFGFAIAVRDLLWVADQLRARGHVDRAYLGVRLEPAAEPATPWQQPEPGAPPAEGVNPIEGALLHEVLAGSPAAAAGLQAGDAIIALDGQPVHSPHDLTDWLDRLPAQSTIRLDVLRGRGPGAKRLSVALQTSGRTEPAAPAAASPSAPISEQVASTGSRAEHGAGHPSLSFVPTAAGMSPSNALTQPGAEPSAIPLAPEQAQRGGASPPGTVASTPARAETPATTTLPAAVASSDPKVGQAESPATSAGSPAPVSIPKTAQSLPRAALPPSQPDDLKLTLPRAVADRLDQLERRLEKLEHQPPSPPEARQTSSMRMP